MSNGEIYELANQFLDEADSNNDELMSKDDFINWGKAYYECLTRVANPSRWVEMRSPNVT